MAGRMAVELHPRTEHVHIDVESLSFYMWVARRSPFRHSSMYTDSVKSVGNYELSCTLCGYNISLLNAVASGTYTEQRGFKGLKYSNIKYHRWNKTEI